MSSRVWFVSELYYPEDTSTGHYVTGIAEGLAQRFQVNVIAGQPTYSRRGQRCPALDERNGVRIERCLSTTWDKNALPLRAVNMMSLSLSLSMRALQRVQRGDVVIVGTNPALLPWATLTVCRARGARCVVRVDDVYPDAAIAAGLIRAESVPAMAFNSVQERVLRLADGIVTMGRCMKSKLESKFANGIAPIVVIPNYADIEDVTPLGLASNAMRLQYGLLNKFVVVLAGNLGRVQGLEIAVEAARELLSDEDVHFLIVGDGAKFGWLRSAKSRFKLTNMTLAGARPRSEQNTFLTAGDIALLTLTRGMVGAGVPSRLYNYLAAGVPIISATGQGSETSLVVEEEGIGWCVEPLNSAELVRAISVAKLGKDELPAMGVRARRAAEERHSRNQIVAAYARAIANVSHGVSINA